VQIGGILQVGIESDALTYAEFNAAGCTGAPVFKLDFAKGAGCQQITQPGSNAPLYITGACDTVTHGASVSVCTDAACSVGCTTVNNYLYNNCTSPALLGGASASASCVDRQQSLHDAVGVFIGLACAIFGLVAALLMADVHQIAYAWVIAKYFPPVPPAGDAAAAGAAAGAGGGYAALAQ